jgi:hypothetical protein
VAARRLTLALPASDPRSARIWAFLEALDPEADSSAELRGLICEALDQGARLARIEAKLDALAAGGLAAAPPAEPPIDPAIIAGMLDFG